MTESQNIPYSTQHDRNRAKISALLGRRMGWPHEIHTHTDGTLVVCEDKTYHMLLHRRTDALETCGHTDWLRCRFCQTYDKPTNLKVYPNPKGGYDISHSKCISKYQNARYSKGKRQKEKVKINPDIFKELIIDLEEVNNK